MTLYTIRLRRGTAAEWVTANPILSDGEPGFEKDTRLLKMGDGVTVWTSLPYTIDVPPELVAALDDLSDVDMTGDAPGKILGNTGGVWGPVDAPAGVTTLDGLTDVDLTGETDGDILHRVAGTWVPGDAPAASDPDAMHSSPVHLLYTYGTVAPTSPADGDIWTDPSDNAPDSLIAAMAAALVQGTAMTITQVGNTFVFAAQPGNKDLRWTPDPARTHLLLKEFRDAADLTGAVRVDSSTPTLGASQARMLVTQAGDSVSVLLDGATSQDAAGELHGWVFPRAGGLAVGEALEMHIIYGGLTYNYSFLGPVVSDGVAYGAGNQVYFPMWGAGVSTNFQDALWTLWNTRGGFSDRPDGSMRTMNFIRIYRSATSTWLYQASPDGKTWITYGTRTLTMTPTHIGFAGGQWGATGKQVYTIDHMRVSLP